MLLCQKFGGFLAKPKTKSDYVKVSFYQKYCFENKNKKYY